MQSPGAISEDGAAGSPCLGRRLADPFLTTSTSKLVLFLLLEGESCVAMASFDVIALELLLLLPLGLSFVTFVFSTVDRLARCLPAAEEVTFNEERLALELKSREDLSFVGDAGGVVSET